MSLQPVLIAGAWRAAESTPAPPTPKIPPPAKPCRMNFRSAVSVRRRAPPPRAAELLHFTAARAARPISDTLRRQTRDRAPEIVECAHRETAPAGRRRAAADHQPVAAGGGRALEGSWALPAIDTKLNIRSLLAPLGPVWVSARVPVRLQLAPPAGFCRRHRHRQPGHRQGQHLASGSVPFAGGRGAGGRAGNRPAARHRR